MDISVTIKRLKRALPSGSLALVDSLLQCETRSDLVRWINVDLAGVPAVFACCETVLRNQGLFADCEQISPTVQLLRNDLISYLQRMDIQVTTDWQAAQGLLQSSGVKPIADLRHQVCGLVCKGTIYINPAIAEVSTPIHEYTHLWAAAMRLGNPSEWQHIVRLFRMSSRWDDAVMRFPHLHTDDELAEELLAEYSGTEGDALLRDLEQGGDGRSSLWYSLACIRQALSHFWKEVADFLHLHYTEPADVAKQVLRDLLRGVNPIGERQSSHTRLPQGLVGVRYSFDKRCGGLSDFIPEMRQLIERAEKDGTLGLAPNGAKSNLDMRQWAQVRTEAFKKWFGDWESDPNNVSRVVDANGEPLVVYHGTRVGGFSRFDNTHQSKHSLSPTGAIWFSNDKDCAMSYAGNRNEVTDFSVEEDQPGIYSCFLNIRRMYISDFDGADWEGIGHELYDLCLEDEQGHFVKFVSNPNGLDYFKSAEAAEAEAERLGLKYYTISNNHWLGSNVNFEVGDVMDNDYGDGLLIANVIDNGPYRGGLAADDYVVFSPNQIKSASCNLGQFDPLEPDIRYQLLEQTAGMVDGGVKRELLGEIHQSLVVEREQLERSWLARVGASLHSGQSDAIVCDSSVFVRQYSALCKLIERTDLLRDAPIQQLVSNNRRMKR